MSAPSALHRSLLPSSPFTNLFSPSKSLLLNFPIRNPNPNLSLISPKSSSSKVVCSAINASGGGGGGGGSKKEQKFLSEGLVTEALPNCMFRVRLENEDEIIGYLSGKMQKKKIMILPGDRVEIEISRYDPNRGRITYRLGTRARKDASK